MKHLVSNHELGRPNPIEMSNLSDEEISRESTDNSLEVGAIEIDSEVSLNVDKETREHQKDEIIDDFGRIIEADDGTLCEKSKFSLNGIEYKTNEKGKIDSVNGIFVGDDNGKEYRDDNGEVLSNCSYVLDGVRYDTDDNRNVYMVDGELLPDNTYELNVNAYFTDNKGRIISCVAHPRRTPDNKRDNKAQRETGGEERRENDQGGHIVSRDLGGDPGLGNLVSMDGRINQSDYKKMEGAIKDDLDKEKNVATKTTLFYLDDSKRADIIKVEVSSDGEVTTYLFDNNMDGALIERVPEAGTEVVKDVLDDTCGVVSSIVQEYDKNGKLKSSTVWITYIGDDEKNYRRKVSIGNE